MIFGLSMNTGEDFDAADAVDDDAAANDDDDDADDDAAADDDDDDADDDDANDGSGGSVDDGPFPWPWDPTNARAILQWTIDAGLDHLLVAFELGNEQNVKHVFCCCGCVMWKLV